MPWEICGGIDAGPLAFEPERGCLESGPNEPFQNEPPEYTQWLESAARVKWDHVDKNMLFWMPALQNLLKI